MPLSWRVHGPTWYLRVLDFPPRPKYTPHSCKDLLRIHTILALVFSLWFGECNSITRFRDMIFVPVLIMLVASNIDNGSDDLFITRDWVVSALVS